MAKKNAIAQLIKSEWNREPEIKQLTIWDALTSTKKSIDQHNRDKWEKQSSGQSSLQVVQNFVQNGEAPKHWIEIYPKKTKHYYRYVFREKGRLHHKHILGGNILNPKAIALKEKVQSAIANGMSSDAIVQIITSSTRS